MMKNLLVLLLSAFPSFCFASEEYPVYLNGTFGAGFAVSGGRDTGFVFGARGGVGLHRNDNGLFSIGLAFNKLTGSKLEVGADYVKVSGSALTLELVTRNVWNSRFYTGGRFGAGFNTITAKSGADEASANSTTFVAGPVLGYEFPVGVNAANVELAWLASTGPTFGALEIRGYSALLLQAGFLFNL